jgi:hypothetical protein
VIYLIEQLCLYPLEKTWDAAVKYETVGYLEGSTPQTQVQAYCNRFGIERGTGWTILKDQVFPKRRATMVYLCG